MEWFVGSAKKDSYSEDFAEDRCACDDDCRTTILDPIVLED